MGRVLHLQMMMTPMMLCLIDCQSCMPFMATSLHPDMTFVSFIDVIFLILSYPNTKFVL